MKFIEEFSEGDNISDVYLCKFKQSAVTRNGKPYINLILQDRSGTIDAKIWEPNSGAISDFEVFDYIYVFGEVNRYQNALQASIKRVKIARDGEYIPADYLPVSEYSLDSMQKDLFAVIDTVKNTYLHELLVNLFKENEEVLQKFKMSSAAKTVHHSFMGGLLQHTLAVTRLCKFYVKAYPALNHDLLITAALLHDIGKIEELSPFPQNDYTDSGQLIGHIVIGAQMVHSAAEKIADFPPKLLRELEHCILAHHGEYEYGSPKKPALMEAIALNFADNTDAKLETMSELIAAAPYGSKDSWLGYNKFFESNLRKAGEWK